MVLCVTSNSSIISKSNSTEASRDDDSFSSLAYGGPLPPASRDDMQPGSPYCMNASSRIFSKPDACLYSNSVGP
jgi:hypothetical protein